MKNCSLTKWDGIFMAVISCFYIFGAIHFVKGGFQDLFVRLTPFVLIFSLLILGLYDRSPERVKALIFSIGVAVTSFLVEFLGVATGLVFGDYNYGAALGLKLGGAPLLIGLNWIFLIYISAAMISSLPKTIITSVILPALFMIGYDLIMEQVAPEMKMWFWEGDSVPLQNYLAWGVLALIFHSVRYKMGVEFRNRMALFLFILQLVFFSIILIF